MARRATQSEPRAPPYRSVVPIYLDRHDLPELTPEELAGAHMHLDVKIGISAGEPVTDENDDLFGASVQLAARLCDSAAPGEIAVSLVVRELCIGKRFRFEPREQQHLKGLSEPTRAYRVVWRSADGAGSGVEGCQSVSASR